MHYLLICCCARFPVICPWDISAVFLSASIFSVPKGDNRASGSVCLSALIKSVDSWVAALAEEIPVIMVFSGNDSTVSTIHSTPVLEI